MILNGKGGRTSCSLHGNSWFPFLFLTGQSNYLATHGLSCQWSEGCYDRHAPINDIVQKALASAKIPARLKPSGLYRSNGMHPNSITVASLKCKELLMWDATCPITFAPLYSSCAISEAGTMASQAEERMERKLNTSTSTPYIPSLQWPLRSWVFWGQIPWQFVWELGWWLGMSLEKWDPPTT